MKKMPSADSEILTDQATEEGSAYQTEPSLEYFARYRERISSNLT
jgi:hypothetical protein